LLDVSKAQLIATLRKAKIGFAQDPSNADPRFTRPRLRALLPALAAEGCDARNLARLAARLARANAALDLLADGAARFLALHDASATDSEFDAARFAALPEEVRVRLLLRTLDRIGHEGPAELGKVEALLAALDCAYAEKPPLNGGFRLKQTLAGAVISLTNDRIRIAPAPPRRRRPG
jgi:tRNA(Ile)-lysidine synthase